MDEVTRYETATGWYESTRHVPRLELRPYVSAYWGLEEHSRGPVHRLEVPYPGVIVMIGFEGAVRIALAEADPDRSPLHRSFVAGLQVSAARTAHDGRMHGAELALTPLGARAFLGVPMPTEFTRRLSPNDPGVAA